jgi:hypothetical protein
MQAEMVMQVVVNVIDSLKNTAVTIQGNAAIINNVKIWQNDDMVWVAEVHGLPEGFPKRIIAQNRNYYFLLEDFFREMVDTELNLTAAKIVCEDNKNDE